MTQESQNKSGLRLSFIQAIEDGDNKASNNNFLSARKSYQKALKIGFDNTTARNKFKENEVALEREFDQLISRANIYYTTATSTKETGSLRAYQDAMTTYNQAKLRFPLNEKEQQKLLACQETLKRI